MSKNYISFLEEYSKDIGEFSGLSLEKINQLETNFNVELPDAYKQYLLSFGVKSGNLLNGYYMNYPDLMDNKEDAIHELNFDERKVNRVEIKDSYFFFAQWQGYNFFFFDCSLKENNPTVFLFDTEKIVKYKDSFIDFIKDEGVNNLFR